MPDWKQFVNKRLVLPGVSGARAAEIAEELAQQLEQCYEEALASGMSRERAAAHAEAQFPEWHALAAEVRRAERPIAARIPAGVARASEQIHWEKSRGWNVFHDVWQDVRFGVRMLLKQPGFTMVAVLTLALAIGSNAAIFSAINAVLLESLPFPDAGQLTVAYGKNKSGQITLVSYEDFLDWRKQNTQFSEISAWITQSVNLTGREEPTRVVGAFVAANFFRMVGVQPSVGRGFRDGEDLPGAERVCVVSYDAWKNVFGADPGFLGKTLTLNNNIFTVVGILPEGFYYQSDADVFLPYNYYPNFLPNRKDTTVLIVARMKPGVPLAQAQNEADIIVSRLAKQYPDTNAERLLEIISLRENTVAYVQPMLIALMGAVVFVLLIACANVANLLLSRAVARQKEIATRVALGAGRVRLIRQMLTETVLLWLAGGALALFLAFWLIQGILAMAPGNLPNGVSPRLNAPVLAFTFALSLLTGILFGLLPALRFSRPDLQESLKESSRGSTAGGARSRLRSALVVAQMALALVLLIGSGLLLRSFLSAAGIRPGFDPGNLLTLEYRLPRNKYPDGAQQTEFHRKVVERVEQIPGVKSAATIRAVPFGGNRSRANFTLPDRPEPPAGETWRAQTHFPDPNYIPTMRIPLLQGRNFTWQDGPNSIPVAMINQNMARKYWPEADPIGRAVRVQLAPQPSVTATIVGVVGDTKHSSLEDLQRYEIYLPQAQQPFIFTSLIVKTAGEPARLASPVRSAVWSVDRDQPVWKVRTMESMMDRSLGPKRFLATLVGGYAFLALLLAAIGIYGVMAYSVSQRVHEIGIRMALGAEQFSILSMVVRQGMWLAAIGVALGIAAAFGVTRFLATLLFGVEPTDPLTFAGVALILAVVALLACLLPARRATRVDPLVALRYE